MSATVSRRLYIKELVRAAIQPGTVSELARRSGTEEGEVNEVLEWAIDAGLICREVQSGCYRATGIGIDRLWKLDHDGSDE